MIIKLMEIAFSGFWSYIGVAFMVYWILYFVFSTLTLMWSRFMRMIMVTKRGWPPSHLDADGDWNSNEEYLTEEEIEK